MPDFVHKAMIGCVAFILTSFVFLGVVHIEQPLKYNDFIVGYLASNPGSKVQDLLVWPVSIFVFWGVSLLIGAATRTVDKHWGSDQAAHFLNQVLVWSLPLAAILLGTYWGVTIEPRMLVWPVIGLLFLVCMPWWVARWGGVFQAVSCSAALLTVMLLSLLPIALSVLLSKMPASLVGAVPDVSLFFGVSVVMAITGCLVLAWGYAVASASVNRGLAWAAVLGQCGLLLFFAVLYPSKKLMPDGQVAGYHTTVYLKVLVLACMIVGLLDIARRYAAWHRHTTVPYNNWAGIYSPFAVFALLLAFKVAYSGVPSIDPDDYHFGEYLLGAWTYAKGAVPYVDYLPAHGLIENYMASLMSFTFYDGTASSIHDAERLVFFFVGLVAFYAMYLYTGSLLLAFFSVLLINARITLFFLVPFICLFLSPGLRRKPELWLIMMCVMAPLLVLGAPPQGIVLLVAFSPLCAKILWDQIVSGDRASWFRIGGVVVALVLVAWATPLFHMLWGAVNYVLINGPINQVAYGLPWHLSWSLGDKSGVFFEAVRMSWVVVPLVALYMLLLERHHIKHSDSYFYTALVCALFCFLLIPYVMGRVDPGSLSRAGFVSLLATAIFMPVLLWNAVGASNRSWLLLYMVSVCSLLGFTQTSLPGLSQEPDQSVAEEQLIDMAAAGLPNMGVGQIDAKQWDRIQRVHAVLSRHLPPEAPYLDLSSRNAQYFYTNRPPVIPVTSPYNMVSQQQQVQAVDILKKRTPDIALLQADNIVHDGGGLSLRGYYLYRFVMDNYVPRLERGLIVGHKKKGDAYDHSTIVAEISPETNDLFLNGFSRGQAIVKLSDPMLVSMLSKGDTLVFPNGESRSIETLDASQAWIGYSGAPLSFHDTPLPVYVDIQVSPEVFREYATSLFQRSFPVSDLSRIPLTWGGSQHELKSKMERVYDLVPVVQDQVQQAVVEKGRYLFDLSNPQLTLDVSSLGISGQRAGILSFDMGCSNASALSYMRVEWWGAHPERDAEHSSVRFLVRTGAIIVPLDASPHWLRSDAIKAIRLQLEDVAACGQASISNIGLYQRTVVNGR